MVALLSILFRLFALVHCDSWSLSHCASSLLIVCCRRNCLYSGRVVFNFISFYFYLFSVDVFNSTLQNDSVRDVAVSISLDTEVALLCI